MELTFTEKVFGCIILFFMLLAFIYYVKCQELERKEKIRDRKEKKIGGKKTEKVEKVEEEFE